MCGKTTECGVWSECKTELEILKEEEEQRVVVAVLTSSGAWSECRAELGPPFRLAVGSSGAHLRFGCRLEPSQHVDVLEQRVQPSPAEVIRAIW